MLAKKGYCRYCGSKCRHLKVKGSVGRCRKVKYGSLRPKNDSKKCNIRNPEREKYIVSLFFTFFSNSMSMIFENVPKKVKHKP